MPQGKVLEIRYRPPWGGVDVSLPEFQIAPNDTPYCKNVVLRAGEIRSRPRISPFIPGPRDGQPVRGLTSFLDGNNAVHTVCFTSTGLWHLNPNWFQHGQDPKNAWAQIAAGALLFNYDTTYAYIVQLNKIYFTNFYSTKVFYWDGMASAVQEATNVAGGLFINELDSHLLLLNTLESGGRYAYRVRWSASGLPTVFDPAVNIGAGYNDMLDCQDIITGFFPIGRNGYIFRTNGITEMVPVGGGTRPFDFNHLWASDRGVGNVFTQSIANYGNIGIFISSDEIYYMGVNFLERIGGKALYQIYKDLEDAEDNYYGNIVPYYTIGYPYIQYQLGMRFPDNSYKMWIYSFTEKSWTPYITSNKYFTGRMNFIAIS